MRGSRTKILVAVGIAAFVVIVAAAFSLSYLDTFLLKQARAQADEYGPKIGRRIVIGDVATKILSGLAVRVSGVEVGPAAGETGPLLVLPRLEVRVALLQLLASAGKQVQVQSVRIDGLTLNVVRFSDGTTNLERLQSRLSQGTGGQAEKAEQQPPDLSRFQVGHFNLNDGSIRFITQAPEKGGRAQ